MTVQAQGIKLNKLLRYKQIKEEYDKYSKLGVPTTVIHRKYIYPKFFVSRQTLYNVLCTAVEKELKEIEVYDAVQVKLDL